MELHSIKDLEVKAKEWSIKNDAIWGQIPLDLMSMFTRKLEEQKVYTIRKFKVQTAGNYCHVPNTKKIVFTASTIVKEVTTVTSIPNYNFSFIDEKYILNNVGKCTTLGDVISLVVGHEPIKRWQSGCKTSLNKIIDMQLLGGHTVPVLFWNTFAIELESLLKSTPDNKPVLILSSVYVSDPVNNGLLQLNQTSATRMWLTLGLQEENSLKIMEEPKKYVIAPNKIKAIAIEKLGALKLEKSNMDKLFRVKCTMNGIENDWFYLGYRNDACLRRADDGVPDYICGWCVDKIEKPIPPVARFRVRLSVFDNNGELEFIIMETEGVKYFDTKAQELLGQETTLESDEAKVPPPPLLKYVGKTVTFLIQLTKFTMDRASSEYTISKILDEDFKVPEVVAKGTSHLPGSSLQPLSCISNCVLPLNDFVPTITNNLSPHELEAGVKSKTKFGDEVTLAEAQRLLGKRKKPAAAATEDNA